MDRKIILKHSKSVRLNNTLLPDFSDLVVELCTIKGHTEYISIVTQLLYNQMYSSGIVDAILEYFEKEYRIIKLEKIVVNLNTAFGNIENKQILNIY